MTIALVFAFTTIAFAQTSGNLSGTVTDSTARFWREQLIPPSAFPTFFNAGSTNNSRDDLSDNKNPNRKA